MLPLLKNPSLECVLSSYRPISNLSFISKLVERAVVDQINEHMMSHSLYPIYQSAYRKHHSTETALLKVHNDILINMSRQQVTLLVMLDLSAAFDTIDHNMLLKHLSSIIGISDTALDWFQSYLSGRSQRILVNGVQSDNFQLPYGVPQGSLPRTYVVYNLRK